MTFFRNALATALLVPTVLAAETPLVAHLSVELNASQPVDQGCKLSFVVVNGHEQDVSKVVYEAVLFDTQGQVSSLMLFDFGKLPAKRPRVRQFVVPNQSCDGVGQVLVNGVTQCDGVGLPEDACMRDLKLGSRTGIEVAG
ncbi:hypothetical protein J7443_21505 [Tropicibacter sp. R15_0]|uniref:hypothetical protein n=1 Tax=Tropicibacter sp. R15_0 TaxID=2821101 RepID=UPI001AD9F81C|nr:hypothetical protein [Tropicibacter sp. R15_0]MBO9467821.1 hypothetical protein [Tropicibacter sp. R15_0]